MSGNSRRLLCALSAAATLAACDTRQQEVRWGEILQEPQISQHRLFAIDPVRTSRSCMKGRSDQPEYDEQIAVRLQINRSGTPRVLSIEGRSFGRVVDLSQDCISLARRVTQTWQYRPFEPGGRPVRLQITEVIEIYPLERWREPRIPFPDVEDLSTARVILQRSGCFGTCPSYQIELRGDGTAIFTGYGDVQALGVHEGSFEPEEFARLISKFREADFFSLLSEYASESTDLPTYRTTLVISGLAATVSDYDGLPAGMPIAVRRLEAEIDRVGRTEHWIGR